MKLLFRFGAITLFGILLPDALAAHAFLDKAVPAVGSTVPAPPKAVTLRFSEDLEPAFSKLRVEGAGGKVLELGPVQAEGAVLSVPLPRLPAGRYRVYWRAVSVDGHASEGDFIFTVAP